MSFLEQINQGVELSIQGCGYKIENDRVMISADFIGSNRDELNMSGTIQIAFSAQNQQNREPQNLLLASTTIGELRGQHFLSDCSYDLLFQHPPTGTWQLSLQLREWDGLEYALIDEVFFDLLYQTQAMSDAAAIYSNEHTTDLRELQTTSPKESITHTESVGSGDGHRLINKIKKAELRAVKGIPKKALERIITERPFQSERAIVNVKGMGPKMLKKLLEKLSN
ncbi:helix-hairpin-helix domain-containing protein [Marinomonas sp. 5E14-1]|uniref:helix-hairpin-helix domain-containing protein n=1 Tax=Marinomonas sp. 5E14-1 TaxID=3153922 RepID=UPI0032644AAB